MKSQRLPGVMRVLSLACLLFAISALTACGGATEESAMPIETEPIEETMPEPTAVAESPVATAEPTVAPPAAAEPEAVAYAPAELADAGLIVEAPENWVRLEPEAVWVPEVTEAPAAMVHPRIGVKMVTLEPPAEAEAVLLPQPAQVMASEPVESPLGTGRSFVVEVYGLTAEGEESQGEVISVEYHVLVSVDAGDKRQSYDFYAAAESAESLTPLEEIVNHMVQSTTVTPMAMPAQGGQANLDSQAVVQAKARLAQHLGVSESDITAVSAEYVDWPDACLGVHEAGQMCAQVITPGYKIVLETGGQQYEVHTDRNGTAVAILAP